MHWLKPRICRSSPPDDACPEAPEECRPGIRTLAIDSSALSAAVLKKLDPAVLIDTVGPFQTRDRKLAEACIESWDSLPGPGRRPRFCPERQRPRRRGGGAQRSRRQRRFDFTRALFCCDRESGHRILRRSKKSRLESRPDTRALGAWRPYARSWDTLAVPSRSGARQRWVLRGVGAIPGAIATRRPWAGAICH